MSEKASESIRHTKEEVIEFAKKHGLKVTSVGMNKNPLDKGWNTPEVYESKQEEYFQGFLEGRWNLGFITGIKCANGYYFTVMDVDSKTIYDKAMKQYENETTVIQSGGKKKLSLHFYFFTTTPVKTFRVHQGELEFDLQGVGAQVLTPQSLHPDTHKPYIFLNKVAPMAWKGDITFDLKQILANAFNMKVESEKVNVNELLEGPVLKGNRDVAAFHLATWYRTKGVEKDEIVELLKRWRLEKCQPLDDDFTESTIVQKVESAFRPEKPYSIRFVEEELFTEEQRQKVQWLMEHPEEIPRYIYLANADVVGEDKNRTIIPILTFAQESLEVTGKSAGGKSKLVDSCMMDFSSTLKDNIVRKITSMTPKSLRHMKEPPHTLYIAERAGMDKGLDETSAEYDIKVGISEHVITATFVNKDTMETEEHSIPVGNFVFTSTEISPPLELGNRIFNLSVDDSIEQNRRVVEYKLDQAAKFPEERIHVEEQKKILRLLFKEMRSLRLKDEDFLIPFAPELRKLLPNGETAIRRHTDKLLAAMYALGKLMYKKLPRVMLNGKECYMITPEIFWYTFKIGDEAIFMQIVGMNRTQMHYWSLVVGLFRKQEKVSIKDVASKTKRSGKTVARLFDFFEENGLIVTHMEGRERFAELLTVTQDNLSGTERTLSLADLDSAHEKWLGSHGLTVTPAIRLEMLDPFTGTLFQGNRENVQFAIGFDPVKITEPRDNLPASKRLSEPTLEEFKSVAQNETEAIGS